MKQLANDISRSIAHQAINDLGTSSPAIAELWGDGTSPWIPNISEPFQLSLERSFASDIESFPAPIYSDIPSWPKTQVLQDVRGAHRPYHAPNPLGKPSVSTEIYGCLGMCLWRPLRGAFSPSLRKCIQRYFWDRHNDWYGIHRAAGPDEYTPQESSMRYQNNQLAPRQKAFLPDWANIWAEIGVSTQPADFAAAEVGVRGLYRLARSRQPEVIVHTASPAGALHGMVYASALLALLPTLDQETAAEIDLAEVARQAAFHALEGRRDEPPEGVDLFLHQRLLVICGDLLALDWGLNYRDGSLDYRRIAYATFLRDICEWEDDEGLEALGHDEAITRNAAMVYYGPRVAAISDRPCEIHVDDDGELHNPDGPAMRFRDGWSIWAIHGVHVDEQAILRPETQTLDQIDAEDNAEAKRIRIERYGWQSYLEQKNALVVEHRRNEIEQTDESLMEFDETKVLVCACPSTGRIYAMEVDPDCQTIQQAQAYLSGDLAHRIVGAS